MTEDSAPLNLKTTLPMKLFEDLASHSQKQRVVAVEKLETCLKKNPGNKSVSDTNIAYTIKRLVRGLASNRKLARVGFATALARCLSTQCVPLSDTLASLSDPSSGAQFLKTSGNMGKADRTHTIIGQLFFVATVSKGILGADKAAPQKIEPSDIIKLASLCADAFKTKPILRQMACSILGQLIAAVTKDDSSASESKAAIFKVVEPLLNVNWVSASSEVDAADLLLLALTAEPVVPTSFWIESSWSSSAESHHKSFVYSLLSDPGKVAAAILSARHTPFIHLSAVKIVNMLSPQLNRHKAKKRFFNFWSELVNERFLLPASAISHKTAALQLGVVALTTFLRQAPSLIPVVLSSQMISLLSSGLRRLHCREHDAVVAFFDELIASFSAKKDKPSSEGEPIVDPSDGYHLIILACFMRPPTRVWQEFPTQFDKMLRASPPATVARFSELAKSIAETATFQFDYEGNDVDSTGSNESTQHRWEDDSAALAARRWAVSHLATNLTLSSSAQSSADVVSIISTVFNSCLFVDKSAKEELVDPVKTNEAKHETDHPHSKAQNIGLFPREQAINLTLRAVCAATSPGMSSHLAATSDSILIMKSVLSDLKKNVLNDDGSVISPLVGDAKITFESLLKISKKKTQPDSVLELLRLFSCHAAILLVCYSNDKDIVSLGNEIRDLFATVADGDDDDVSKENSARVFLDMLISLLSRKSRPIRNATTSMFVRLINNRKLFGLLSSSSNADNANQASSLIDLIVNALLNTQFVEDGKEGCDSSDEEKSDNDDDAEDDDQVGAGQEDEGTGDDGGNGIGKKLKSKRKRTASGHIVASTAPFVQNDGNDDDALSSIDSVLMDDDEMFKLDSVFAAAVRASTAGGGPAKRAKKERKNQFQQMKEFHMKLVSWLEMVIQKAQVIAKEDDPTCDGNQILVDVIAILINTLANKKRVCSPVIEVRFCELLRAAVAPWRQSKAVETDSFGKVGNALAPAGEMILDGCLQIVHNTSAIPPKLETAGTVVELLLLCSSAFGKSTSISAALKNSVDAYLTHPSPHGHIFFSTLLSSPRLKLKQLEHIFFDRLLACVSGRETIKGEEQQRDTDETGNDDKNTPSSKGKSFPRSQAARLLANSQLVTAEAYNVRPKICQELGLVIDEVVQSFAADKQDEKEELIKDTRKSAQQPFLYRNIIDLAKRHVYAVLKTATSSTERVEKLECFTQLASNIEKIRENSTGKKSADVRRACVEALSMLKKPKQQQPKNQESKNVEETPVEVKAESVKSESGKKRRHDASKSDSATPEKVIRESLTNSETPKANKSSSKKKTSSANN